MAVKVHNRTTGNVEDVPSAVAQQGLADGSMALADSRVRVVRGNELGTVSSDDLAQAVGQGFRLVDDDEAAGIRLRKESSGLTGSARGAAEAALAGATLGASDYAAVELLGADREAMRARREGLGSFGAVAETAGALLPVLLTGGAAVPVAGERAAESLGARAVRAAISPAEALGASAGRAGAKALAKVAPGGFGRSVVPLGVHGATEGLVYGVGSEISEATLGGREITAERLMAAGGMGALLGGATGGVFGGLGKIAVGGTRAPRGSMEQVLARMSDGTVDSTHPVAKALGGVWGMSPDDVVRGWRKFKSGEMADYFYRSADKADEIRGAVFREAKGFKDDLDQVIAATSGERKMKRIESMIPSGSDARAPWRLADDLDDMRARVDAAEAENKATFGRSYEPAAIREAKGALEKAAIEVRKASSGVEAFRIAERAKKQVGNYARKLGRMYKRSQTPQMEASLDLLEGDGGVNGMLRGFLTDERLFGQAAIAQKEIAAADHAALSLIEQNKKGGSLVGKLFRGDHDITSREAMLFVKRWGRAGSESLEEGTDTVFRAQINAMQKRLEYLDLDPKEVAAIKRLSKRYESMSKALEEQRKHVDTYDLAQRFRQAEGQGSPSITTLSTLGPSAMGLVGSSLGPVGAAAGMLIGSITRPYTMLRTLSGIHDIATKAGLRIDGAVERFVVGFGQKVERAATRTAPKPLKPKGLARKATTRAGIAALSPDEREKKLDEVRSRAVVLAQSPEALQQALQDMVYEIDAVAPGVAESLQRVTQRGAAYLAAHAPKPYIQPFSGRPPVISRVEASAFARRVEATVYPIETLEDRLADGTLTAEHTDALEEVWPEIFDGVKRSIGAAVVQAQVTGKAIPAPKRATLGRLFGVPIGPGADVTMAASQQIYGSPEPGATPPPPDQQQGPKPGNMPRNVELETKSLGVYTQGSRAERGLKE